MAASCFLFLLRFSLIAAKRCLSAAALPLFSDGSSSGWSCLFLPFAGFRVGTRAARMANLPDFFSPARRPPFDCLTYLRHCFSQALAAFALMAARSSSISRACHCTRMSAMIFEALVCARPQVGMLTHVFVFQLLVCVSQHPPLRLPSDARQDSGRSRRRRRAGECVPVCHVAALLDIS